MRQHLYPIAGPILIGIAVLVFAIVVLGMAILLLQGVMIGR
jgi:hypothetical protein